MLSAGELALAGTSSLILRNSFSLCEVGRSLSHGDVAGIMIINFFDCSLCTLSTVRMLLQLLINFFFVFQFIQEQTGIARSSAPWSQRARRDKKYSRQERYRPSEYSIAARFVTLPGLMSCHLFTSGFTLVY